MEDALRIAITTIHNPVEWITNGSLIKFPFKIKSEPLSRSQSSCHHTTWSMHIRFAYTPSKQDDLCSTYSPNFSLILHLFFEIHLYFYLDFILNFLQFYHFSLARRFLHFSQHFSMNYQIKIQYFHPKIHYFLDFILNFLHFFHWKPLKYLFRCLFSRNFLMIQIKIKYFFQNPKIHYFLDFILTPVRRLFHKKPKVSDEILIFSIRNTSKKSF